jgi:hypothetical protein
MNKRSFSIEKFSLVVAFVYALVVPIHSEAAAIIWDAPTLIGQDSDVSTTGTLLYAFTFGGTGVPTSTVNGVTFASFAAPNGGSSPVTVSNVTFSLPGGDFFRSTLTETGSTSAPFSALSSAYKGFLQSAISDGVDPSHSTLTLGALTPGNIYEVQFWANESASFTNTLSNNTETILTAGNAATLDLNASNTTGGLGQWVTGSFTADGMTQAIDITGGNPAGASPILNGFQVRTVPEPTSIGLFGLAATLLTSRRRRIS